uniref:NADH-ubiquinone oxidoreductase chain 6 n=1 Tax=Alloeorhynchus bakeri TaxID=796621 RepID=G9B4J3_9HEMI|nr:NADH dehydrogenase subunit 6 [Alloeorhynchus bakeri]ADI75229.1 NADH dehydrogenase subunit 6 [Alloeorhynchus bakeri]
MDMYFIMMLILTSMLLPLLKHPLSMGLIIILQTLITAMITGQMINMFWFSYILMLTMTSGMLVLFIYMASMASNEKFKSMKMSVLSLILMLLPFMIMINYKEFFMINLFNNKYMTLYLNYEQSMIVTSLFNKQALMITIMLVMYLFYSLISVSWIVNVFEGPLRSKN